jgi:putative flippase GtrA
MKIHGSVIKYFKYCAVGAFGAVIDFSIYTVLVKYFLINYLAANIVSISIALIVVYYLQKNWTFQYVVRDKSKTFQRYLVSVVITFILNNGVLFCLVGILGYDAIISKIIQIILSMVWGFILTNFFVFRKKMKLTMNNSHSSL